MPSSYQTYQVLSNSCYPLSLTDYPRNSAFCKSPDYIKPQQINKDQHGCYPIYRRSNSLEEGTDYVVKEIKRLKEQTTCKFSEMVVLHRRRDDRPAIQQRLNHHKIPNRILGERHRVSEAEEIKLCTMHSIKGLEARVVFILGVDDLPNADNNEVTAQERKLLYVGTGLLQTPLFYTSFRCVTILSCVHPTVMACSTAQVMVLLSVSRDTARQASPMVVSTV